MLDAQYNDSLISFTDWKHYQASEDNELHYISWFHTFCQRIDNKAGMRKIVPPTSPKLGESSHMFDDSSIIIK